MKNILIVGVHGFIGQNIWKHFSSQIGNIVWGCGIRPEKKEENYIYVDPNNPDYNSIFSSRIFELCINCSGSASVPLSLQNPYKDFTMNVDTVYRILEAIKVHRPTCRFINFSSAAVYGNPIQLPIRESDYIQPISPYGYHKAYSEQILNQFYKNFEIQTISLRVFSAFGPGLKKQLFWDLYTKSKLGKNILLSGTGNESRDFIYIDDLCRAVELISKHVSFEGQAINVANGYEISISEAVSLFFTQLNEGHEISFDGNPRIGDPLNWRAEIQQLEKCGYKQKVSLEDGLNNYVKWVRKSI